MLPAPHDELLRRFATFITRERLITDPLRLLAWGSDASFYRLTPTLVVVVESEAEVQRVLEHCAQLGTPVTFRAAGTSLSGQALSDSVLVLPSASMVQSQQEFKNRVRSMTGGGVPGMQQSTTNRPTTPAAGGGR